MNIFELKERKEEIESDVRSYQRTIERQRNSLEPSAVNLTKDIVSGNPPRKTIEDVIHIIVKMEKLVKNCKEELKNIENEVHEKEIIYNKYNNRDKLLYIDKRLNKLNNAQLEMKYGIGKRRINKIVKKIEKNYK